MRAIRVSRFGGEEELQISKDVPIPSPGDDEVLIKVEAAGVNPVDTYIRQGLYDKELTHLPYTPGRDCSGTVEAVGKNVTDIQKGERVIAVFTVTGSYAEYCTAKRLHVCTLDSKLSFQQGASIGVPYYTAYNAIFFKACGTPGQTALVHGASGAVGIASIQILKANGFKVIGTAGTKEGEERVKQAGADIVYNHREKGYMQTIFNIDTDGKGVDIILEMLANVNLQNDLEILAFRGCVVNIGCRGNIEINPRLLIGRETKVVGIKLPKSTLDEWTHMHAALKAGQQKGWIKPDVGKVYKLDAAEKAHYDIIHNEGTTGKLVLDPSA